jgi:biofilm PGA synthesis N-glycosyltransferase PgaC
MFEFLWFFFVRVLPLALTIFSVATLLAVVILQAYNSIFSHESVATTRYKEVNRIAVLSASKDGEKTIAATVRAAKRNRRHVYVVSDGSKDGTVREARKAGAEVLALRKNIGKPSALHRAYKKFHLGSRYDAVAILDDDVLIARDFIKQTKSACKSSTAISVGHNITDWPHERRWNVWLATRAYSYWYYQIMLRRLQSGFNVMNCISGSNSLYRTEVLNQVLRGTTPYIVDDTYWTLETHRLQLGEIVYAPHARAWIQDPTNFKDWYKQNLRWMWGTFQGVIGHYIGSEFNKFHMSYVLLITEWILYILSGPMCLLLLIHGGWARLPVELLALTFGYGIWVLGAASSLKRPRLILFIPAVVMVDFIFRFIMVHGFVKALQHKTVKSCVWNSPTRFAKPAIA